MKITFASNQRWVKTISPDIFSDFGKNNTRKIKKLIASAEENPTLLSQIFSSLDSDFIDWFSPFYEKHILSRTNPKPHQVYETTLGKKDSKYPYFSMTLMEAGDIIGGAIFTLREDRLSIVYRAFKPKWTTASLTGTPALYGEYLLTKHAQEQDKPMLVHGSDKNPYGINSGIGLAIFKLSVGCQPELQKTHTVDTIDLSEQSDDILVLELPAEGERITQAYLVTTDDRKTKYEQLFKYPDRLTVNLILRPS